MIKKIHLNSLCTEPTETAEDSDILNRAIIDGFQKRSAVSVYSFVTISIRHILNERK